MKPGDADMSQWTRLSLVQIIVCRLSGIEPLTEQIQEKYNLYFLEENLMFFYLPFDVSFVVSLYKLLQKW